MKVFVVALALAASAAHAADEQRYQLRPDERNIFGFLLGNASGNAEFVLPFDKAYAQLTVAQQARLKEAYVDLGASDEPPFPLGGLKALYEPITDGQQRLGASGVFAADVEIGETGEPIAMAVHRSPNRTVTKFVSQVVMLTRFKPAVCSGSPCKMGFPVRMTFTMQ